MSELEYESFEGKPITYIDHQFGEDKVFDSKTNRGVAVRMKGYLYFPDVGKYSIQALSNDGVFVYVSDELAISDPKQHSDRLSNIANITIDKAGWYPFRLDYFQRKGTAALKLFWKTPKNDDFVAIPAASYGH
jgi:MSHA biogenesis protein MshQ